MNNSMIEKGTILIWKEDDKTFSVRKGEMAIVKRDYIPPESFIQVEFIGSKQEPGGYRIERFYTQSEWRDIKLRELGI